jgi:hypothetical protein
MRASDGLMISRNYLGMYMPVEKVTHAQTGDDVWCCSYTLKRRKS